MHALSRCAPFLAALMTAAAVAQPLRMPADPCDEAKPFTPFEFEGQRFSIAPGIDSPELQLIDAVISTRGCLDRAQEMLDAYRAAHPDDYHADFMQGRIDWIAGDDAGAEARLKALLEAHPDFHAVNTLVGSLVMDRAGPREAMPWLQRVRERAPGDVWGYAHYVRARFLIKPSIEDAELLLRIAAHPGFPPNARESAGLALDGISGPGTEGMNERGSRILMTFESATPLNMKALNLAQVLIAESGKQEEGRALARPLIDNPWHRDRARRLIAESLMNDAYALDHVRSDRNQALIERALSMVDGDEAVLAAKLRASAAHHLIPLLPSYASRGKPGADGNTELCRAIIAQDSGIVRMLLSQKADPNATCNGMTPMVVFATRPSNPDTEFAIARALLGSGADSDPVVPATGQRLSEYCHEDAERSTGTGCRALIRLAFRWSSPPE